MVKRRKAKWQGGITAVLLCAGAATLVAAPSAGLALAGMNGTSASAAHSGFLPFTPASVDPRLAKLMAERRDASGLMQFTPAGSANRSGHSITVAVRIDDGAGQLVSLRSARAASQDQLSGGALRIASTRYNLGLSRGYQSFAQAPDLSTSLSEAAIPDLSVFKPSEGVKSKPSRFNARLAVEEESSTARSGSALNDQTFDLGGSYRVTRNLDVTAGVRYSQDRDRMAPLTNSKQDSQAVYVGTQFRF